MKFALIMVALIGVVGVADAILPLGPFEEECCDIVKETLPVTEDNLASTFAESDFPGPDTTVADVSAVADATCESDMDTVLSRPVTKPKEYKHPLIGTCVDCVEDDFEVCIMYCHGKKVTLFLDPGDWPELDEFLKGKFRIKGNIRDVDEYRYSGRKLDLNELQIERVK